MVKTCIYFIIKNITYLFWPIIPRLSTTPCKNYGWDNNSYTHLQYNPYCYVLSYILNHCSQSAWVTTHYKFGVSLSDSASMETRYIRGPDFWMPSLVLFLILWVVTASTCTILVTVRQLRHPLYHLRFSPLTELIE